MSVHEWRYREGVDLSLVSDGTVLARYHFATDRQKPFIHPLRTSSGALLTCLEPSDHLWHRGLWFAWKFLNGLNYWEEEETFPVEAPTDLPDGVSWSDVIAGLKLGGTVGLTEPERVSLDGGRAAVETTYKYRQPDGVSVLTEQRLVVISEPDSAGRFRLDWTHQFEAADGPVVIDRTPVTEDTPWGGYAGLSFRAARSLSAFRAVDSEGRTDADIERARARWVDLSGFADGGPYLVAAGLTIFDHPTNERHPTHWRCILEPGFGYVNPAFVFADPYTLEPGKPLTLFYRVLIHDGWADPEELEREAQRFASEECPANT